MEKDQKKPTPTPELGTLTVYKDWKHWKWPYEWAPTIAMLLQIGGAGLGWYFSFNVYGLNEWLSLAVAAISGIFVGFLYNQLAPSFGWQKLHWIDVVSWAGPWSY